jgi:hypothetical protein
VDPGIYVFIKEGELYVLAWYVDDIIIVGPMGSFIGFMSAFGEGSTCKTSVLCLGCLA